MPADPGQPRGRQSALKWTLRLLGGLDLLALAVVVMPRGWIEHVHLLSGLGDMPREPVVGYLARSASVMYALHGAMILFISRDVVRYRSLIAFLAWAAVIHSALLAYIDVEEGMPRWWTLAEGPCFAATGIVVLLQMRGEQRASPG